MNTSSEDASPWNFPGLHRDTFAATSFALASTRPYQHNEAAACTNDQDLNDDDVSSDDESVHPRDLARAGGKVKLQ